MDENANVGAILLKLRFLAAKLDTDILEEWVRYEAEGYPNTADLPDYRTAHITYTGTFFNIARQLNNISIPSALVAQIAGDNWLELPIRESLPLIEDRLRKKSPEGHFGIDCSNLKLLLEDKIYPGMSIVDINSRIDIGAFNNIQHTVRAKTLNFTLQIEKQVPAVASIEVGARAFEMSADEQKSVKRLTQHIFYGDVTNINSSGDANSRVNVNSTDNSSNVAD